MSAISLVLITSWGETSRCDEFLVACFDTDTKYFMFGGLVAIQFDLNDSIRSDDVNILDSWTKGLFKLSGSFKRMILSVVAQLMFLWLSAFSKLLAL